MSGEDVPGDEGVALRLPLDDGERDTGGFPVHSHLHLVHIILALLVLHDQK